MNEAVFDEAVNHARYPLRIGDRVEVWIRLRANGAACFASMRTKEFENTPAIDAVWMGLFIMTRFLRFFDTAFWNGDVSREKARGEGTLRLKRARRARRTFFADRGRNVKECLWNIKEARMREPGGGGCVKGGVILRCGKGYAEQEASQQAANIGVYRQNRLLPRKGAHGCGGIRPDAFERLPAFWRGGFAVLRDMLGEALEGKGATVVSKTRPTLKHEARGGIGEDSPGGKHLHPRVIVRNHALNLRLLQHVLTNKNRVRILCVAPRKIPSMDGKPRQKRVDNGLHGDTLRTKRERSKGVANACVSDVALGLRPNQVGCLAILW